MLNVGGGSVAGIVRMGRSYHSYGVDFLRGRGLLAPDEAFVNAWPLRDRAPKTIEDPNGLVRFLFGRNVFEVPDVLPENLNY